MLGPRAGATATGGPELYPPGLPPADRLARYAAEFSTAELNSSFYRWPRPAAFRGWQQRLAPGFQLSVKAPRGLTHGRKLHEPEDWISRIREGWHELDGKRAVLLIQLGPGQERDDARRHGGPVGCNSTSGPDVFIYEMRGFPFPGGPSHERDEPLLAMLLTGSRSLRLPRSSCMRITREPGRPGESWRAGGGGGADRVRPGRRPGRRLAPLPADQPDAGPLGCLSPSVPGSPRQRSAWAVSLRRTPARCPARSRISPVLRSVRRRPAVCPAGARQDTGCAARSSTPGHTAPPARRPSRPRGWPGRPEVRAGSTPAGSGRAAQRGTGWPRLGQCDRAAKAKGHVKRNAHPKAKAHSPGKPRSQPGGRALTRGAPEIAWALSL